MDRKRHYTSSLLYCCRVIITNVLGSESFVRPYEGALEKIFFQRINCKWCVNSALIVENCILYSYSARKKQGGESREHKLSYGTLAMFLCHTRWQVSYHIITTVIGNFWLFLLNVIHKVDYRMEQFESVLITNSFLISFYIGCEVVNFSAKYSTVQGNVISKVLN